MRRYTLLVTLAIVVMLALAITVMADNNATQHSPHDADGFHNRYIDSAPHGSFIRWQWDRLWNGTPKPPQEALAPVAPDLDFITHNQNVTAVTWVGHATLLLQVDGLNILTDPIFSDYASPLPPLGPKRYQKPGLTLTELPHIDVVVISHNHYDHMDLPSLRALAAQAGGAPQFFIPLGNESWFKDNVPGSVLEGPARNVHAFNWGEHGVVQGHTANLELYFAAVQHWSSRTLWDRNKTLWGSWALLHPRFRFWFSGDLGYSKDVMDIGAQFGHFDLAAIAIGSYEPRWFMARSHVNPAEAIQVMEDIHARQAIGIHWGTFQMSDEPLDQPPHDLQAALQERGIPAQRFTVLRQGETRQYPH